MPVDIDQLAKATAGRVLSECVDHAHEVFPEEATAIIAEAMRSAIRDAEAANERLSEALKAAVKYCGECSNGYENYVDYPGQETQVRACLCCGPARAALTPPQEQTDAR